MSHALLGKISLVVAVIATLLWINAFLIFLLSTPLFLIMGGPGIFLLSGLILSPPSLVWFLYKKKQHLFSILLAIISTVGLFWCGLHYDDSIASTNGWLYDFGLKRHMGIVPAGLLTISQTTLPKGFRLLEEVYRPDTAFYYVSYQKGTRISSLLSKDIPRIILHSSSGPSCTERHKNSRANGNLIWEEFSCGTYRCSRAEVYQSTGEITPNGEVVTTHRTLTDIQYEIDDEASCVEISFSNNIPQQEILTIVNGLQRTQ